jgi:arsenite methyltransferase
MAHDTEPIHEAVRERYGAAARRFQSRQQAASCCGPAPSSSADCDCSPEGLYDPEWLKSLPADLSGLSLGCGDPVTIASLRPGEVVVDLGSGGGLDCFFAAKQVGETGHVIGVDMTPDMLDLANRNKAAAGLTNVEFRMGTIEALPVESDSVDVIMSNCVINLSPDKPAVFREAFRVLKPGGRAAISDIVTQGEFDPEARAQMDLWAACVTGAIDVERYTGMMREAGFVDVEVVGKVSADEGTPAESDLPRIFSARIAARKPA